MAMAMAMSCILNLVAASQNRIGSMEGISFLQMYIISNPELNEPLSCTKNGMGKIVTMSLSFQTYYCLPDCSPQIRRVDVLERCTTTWSYDSGTESTMTGPHPTPIIK